MPKFIYREQTIQEAKRLRQCGYTYQEISDLTGMKMTTVIQPINTAYLRLLLDDAHLPNLEGYRRFGGAFLGNLDALV